MLNWLRSCGWLWCMVSIGLSLAGSTPLLAGDPAASKSADDEDDEPVRFPGIIGTYTAFGRSVSRRDPDIAFVWDKVSPAQQLHEGLFQAEWQGKLLVRAPGKYRFYAQVQGEVEAILANQPILKGKTDAGRPAEWITGPEFEFEYGEHPLDVIFRSTGSEARVKLYWSSDAFGFEPVPSAAYFLHQPRPDLELVSQGQELFAAHRCNRCHRRPSDPRGPPAPDLTHVSHGLTDAALERWLSPERPRTPHFNMPEFDFTAAESRSIAHYLRANSSAPTLAPDTPFDSKTKADKLLADGRLLFHTIGCLACHSYGEVGSKSRFGGGDLTTIGSKRSAEWLRQWLTQPAKINADHRMPVFEWDRTSGKDELQEMVAFLTSSRSDAAEPETDAFQQPATPESIAEGRKLIEAARCAACHRIPGIQNVDTSKFSKLENLNAIGKNSCLQVEPNRENWRPGFSEQDLEALRAYITSRTGKLAGEGTTEMGHRFLAWNNCLQCHPREGTPGLGAYAISITKLFPELNGSVPTLVPPSLNAVGDKLQPFAFGAAMTRSLRDRRLPWLRVRMPRFGSERAETDVRNSAMALLDHFINHDRIDNPPAELVAPPPVLDDNQRRQAQAAGHTLLGSQGFSCIACHQFGRFTPRNTALGTRGSDLQYLVKRMRPEYFLRWTRSPIRVVPDMEMPGFERPFPGLLGDKISSQLWALWLAANDSKVTRPVDVASLQQSWLVRAGEPARIVRDVFALPPDEELRTGGPDRPADTYLPRAFAVGLNNQHNILFDLDTFAVREWWQGNFARQRTEGKSWYWDMGGPRVQSGIANYPQIVLSHGEYEHPTGQLIEYGPHEQGVKLVYTLKLRECEGSTPDAMRVTESWQPMAPQEGSKKSGWLRKISVKDVPKGLTPSFYLYRNRRSAELWDIELVPGSLSRFEHRPCILTHSPGPERAPAGDFAKFIKTADQPFSLELQYVSNSTLPGIETPEVPPVISTQETYSTVPGYTATRLPLPRSIMPTAMTWTKDKVMAFTSLKGHVYFARDTNGDGLEDKLDLYEEGLAAPYGIITDSSDGSLLVAHKPEVLRLTDTNKDGRADRRDVFATGWGYNDNYHDWTCGIVRDAGGNLYVGLGSDYTQPKRPAKQQLWRGKILRISPAGQVTPIASGLRYPTGLAMNSAGDLFATDNQGEQNTFNELNFIAEGHRYGVPSREDKPPVEATIPPAIQIPHPWTRSINGIFFLPPDTKLPSATEARPHPFAGHGIGCEYDTRYLIRFTLQKVGDTYQGAVYPFSQDQVSPDQPNFEGTLCGGVSPKGDIYIGCIHDSGWLGGLNVGSIVQLKSNGQIPLGIRELRAVPEGFEIQFTAPVDRLSAANAGNFTIAGYTREWKGTYATPDSNRHVVAVNKVTVSDDGRQVVLHTDKLRTGHVYEVSCGKIGPASATALWPATGHYTMNRLPVEN